MSRTTKLAVWFALSTCTCAFYVACGSEGEVSPESAANPIEGGVNAADGNAMSDATDPRCGTQAVLLDTHPHAKEQSTDLGKTISDVRGFNGNVYLAYGDIEINSGPIYITSWDANAKTWVEHPVAYREEGTGTMKSTAAFATHAIERFIVAGGSIWAPAAQVDARPPFDVSSPPEYAVGSATHAWSQVDIAPKGLHIVDVIERAPGDLYVTGSGIMDTDASVAANGRAGGFIWRSQSGGPFIQLFPSFDSKPGEENFDLTGSWFHGAALNGTAYFWLAGFVYKFDGTKWDFNEPFGEFLRPASFAGQLVFADLGQFFSFDGTTRHNLDFRFFESKGRYQGMKEPLALFQVTEGKLLAVKYGGDVMMTTDLKAWSCIGKAPADATAIGSLDGTVYFGGVNSQLFAFPTRSW